MTKAGWQRLMQDGRRPYGPGRFTIPAYSEFMPPPRLGFKPYGPEESSVFDPRDPFGWKVDEYEEAWELRPGLAHIAKSFLGDMAKLAAGKSSDGIALRRLTENPFWPPELSARAGSLGHDRLVLILPLALSRTQDDKGRVRWTLFGGSEQGPEKAFWKSFVSGPADPLPAGTGVGFIRRLLKDAYGDDPDDLLSGGFRILPGAQDPAMPGNWRPERLPAWALPYALKKGEPVRRVRYLLTFRPFSRLPASIRSAYLEGRLHLLPFPGSLMFWGVAPTFRLQRELPFAFQIPLLETFVRSDNLHGIRIPQSGWMHEPSADSPRPDDRHGPVRNTYRRTHRWARIHRDENELAVSGIEDRLAHVLFSAAPEDVGLYGKPMARNCQIWTHDHRLLLDGPRAGRADLERAAAALRAGGHFGYRFIFPAMRAGRHEVYWHRPLVAFRAAASDEPTVLDEAPTGYLTAYPADRPDLGRPVELWPRVLRRPLHRAAVSLASAVPTAFGHRCAMNLRKLAEAWELMGQGPLPPGFARSILTAPKEETLEDWLAHLEVLGGRPVGGPLLVDEITARLQPESTGESSAEGGGAAPSLTFGQTAQRRFETAYWETIRRLAHGRFVNKDNADCVQDQATRAHLPGRGRDLAALGDYLIDHYRDVIRDAGMAGRALVGDAPFSWRTDFDYDWSGGWLANRRQAQQERNIITVIPGRNRRAAVIMADHYDTAFMEDVYDKARGGSGARLAAAGADDNHSATAALMLAAPIFLALSREGRLGCDVWLVHLTGEEFPSDCMGARNLAQQLIERTLRLRVPGRRSADLSRTRIRGAYILDMVAHNNDKNRDVFQISPGAGRQSLWLAHQAHRANRTWNQSVPAWNSRPARRDGGQGMRSPDPHGRTIPALARHLAVHGEVRLPHDPRSSLFNTDAQIFSDAGIPVVLFMENYDINRVGYHDTHDTMANIDLDYGAAVAAIAIESVARAARQARL
jgi:hypothetical protein